MHHLYKISPDVKYKSKYIPSDELLKANQTLNSYFKTKKSFFSRSHKSPTKQKTQPIPKPNQSKLFELDQLVNYNPQNQNLVDKNNASFYKQMKGHKRLRSRMNLSSCRRGQLKKTQRKNISQSCKQTIDQDEQRYFKSIEYSHAPPLNLKLNKNRGHFKSQKVKFNKILTLSNQECSFRQTLSQFQRAIPRKQFVSSINMSKIKPHSFIAMQFKRHEKELLLNNETVDKIDRFPSVLKSGKHRFPHIKNQLYTPWNVQIEENQFFKIF